VSDKDSLETTRQSDEAATAGEPPFKKGQTPGAVKARPLVVPEDWPKSFALERTADAFSSWPPQNRDLAAGLPDIPAAGPEVAAEIAIGPTPVQEPDSDAVPDRRELAVEAQLPLIERMDRTIAARDAMLPLSPPEFSAELDVDTPAASAGSASIEYEPGPMPAVPEAIAEAAAAHPAALTQAALPSEIPDATAQSTFDPVPANSRRIWLRRVAGFAIKAAAAYAGVLLALVALFRFVDPPGSALMALRWAGGTDISQRWAPIERISPHLVRAVVVSEDWGFCGHSGIDLDAIEQAIEKAGDGIPRGASTISMQVAKNMFLWPAKSYVRKAIEVPLTLAMELMWPKKRILEVYLNVAEWGPGVFGAEAAAQHHFQKSAASLSIREAAQLAASLPNPFRRDAGDPGPQTARKASIIQVRMRSAGNVADCAIGAPKSR